MQASQAVAIDIVEAAYDVEAKPAEWLPHLIEAGAPSLDLGLGCLGALWAGKSEDGRPVISQAHQLGGPEDLPLRFRNLSHAAGAEFLASTASRVAGQLFVLSESPRLYDVFREAFGCEDMLILVAADPNLVGAALCIPTREVLRLTRTERQRWERLGVHIAAGRRIRATLGETNLEQTSRMGRIEASSEVNKTLPHPRKPPGTQTRNGVDVGQPP